MSSPFRGRRRGLAGDRRDERHEQRARGHAWCILGLVPALLMSCRNQSDSLAAAQARQARAAVAAAQCQPAVLLLARDENVEVANEWEKGDLIVTGCRDRLRSITPEQRKSVVAALRSFDRAKGERLRLCRGLEMDPAPDQAAMLGVDRALGPAVITDWCWATRAGEW
jgi:hypothetical protein